MKNSMRAVALLLVSVPLLVSCSEKKSDQITASGIIETTDVNVAAKTTGQVLQLKVREGDHVHVGDTLLVVDDADLQLQKQQLLAGVDVASAQLQLLRNGSRPEDVVQAEESVQQVQINVASAHDDMKRNEELYHAGAIPEKSYTDAKTRHDVLQRQLAASQSALAKLRHGSRTEDISAGQSRREQASVQVAAIDKKISDSHLRSPVEGIVTVKGIEQGEFVSAGAPVLTISDNHSVKLKIYVPENELGRVHLGQEADLIIDTFKDKHYSGRVTYISPTAEFTPKNVQTKDDRVKLVFEVRIEVPNPSGDLKAGITADAVLRE